MNVQFNNMGQSGVQPQFLYINTNDTPDAVIAVGYLNKLVNEGLPISQYEMALVVTKSTPSSISPIVNLYQITNTLGQWSLVLYNGNPFSEIELINALGDTITLKPPATAFTDVAYTLPAAPGTSGFVLSSTTTGTMSWIAPGGGGGGVTGAANVGTGNGLFFQNSAGTLQFYSLERAGYIQLSSGLDDNIIIGWDEPGFNLANHTMTGNWAFNTGTLTSNSSSISLNSDGPVTITSNSSYVNLIAPDVTLYANVGNLSLETVNYMILAATGGILIPGLISGTTANIIYYDASAGQLSYGSAGPTVSRVNVTTATQAMAVNTQYMTNDPGAQVVYTLPTTAEVNDVIILAGNSASGWAINQNAGQNIQVAEISTTIGVGGSIVNTNQFDGISLICSVANTTFVSSSVVGNLTIT